MVLSANDFSEASGSGTAILLKEYFDLCFPFFGFPILLQRSCLAVGPHLFKTSTEYCSVSAREREYG